MDTGTKSLVVISAEDVLRERIREQLSESERLRAEMIDQAKAKEQEALQKVILLVPTLRAEAERAIRRLELLGLPDGELLEVAMNPTVMTKNRLFRKPEVTVDFKWRQTACWSIHPVKKWYVTSDTKIIREQNLSDESGNQLSNTPVLQEFVLTPKWLHIAEEALEHLRALAS